MERITYNMKTQLLLVTLCSAALLGACATNPDPVPPPPIVVVPAPLPSENEAQKLREAQESKAAAAAAAEAFALDSAPTSPPVELAKGEGKIVVANLRKATPEDTAEALARVSAGLSGNMTEALRKQQEALKTADELRDQLAEAQRKADADRAESARILGERETEWGKRFTALENAAKDAQEELRKAKDAISRKVQFWFGLILRLVAAGLLLVAGLKAKAAIASGLPSGEAVRGSLATLALAAGGFALSWAVAQWWFFYACAGFAVLVFGTWAAHAYFADKAKGTLNKIGAAIDAGKANPDATTATVDLAQLGRKMNTSEKAIVTKLRKVRAKAAVS